MTTDKNTAENGSFRKRQSFTMASNSAIRDKNISLKAKGLYTLIMSYITMPDLILTKDFLRKRCMEGKKAFESAWIELKENGYLKIYIQPSSDHGRWCVQYDLLDEADLADGVHTFYRNLSGETTDTNITKKEKRIHSAHHTRTKQSPPDNNLQHIPHFGIYADGVYAKGYDAKGGNKLILTYNTSNNTLENHSIYQIAETYTDNSELLDQVIDDLITYCGIPYFYAADQKKMETAIRYLADWDSRQQCPYTNATGHVDEQAMNAFNFCVDCLIDMACAQEQRSYRGTHVTSIKVIDAINRMSDCYSQGSLSEFLDEAVDDLTKAYTETEIRDLRKYTMSVVWNCFSSYKVKQDADFCAQYHQTRPCDLCHSTAAL